MSRMSTIFYDLLEMMELGHSDEMIADATGFPVDAIKTWRADAELTPVEDDRDYDHSDPDEDGLLDIFKDY